MLPICWADMALWLMIERTGNRGRRASLWPDKLCITRLLAGSYACSGCATTRSRDMRIYGLPSAGILLMSATTFAQSPVQQNGQASYYNSGQSGHTRTANGDKVDPGSNTAASRDLPLGTKATVTNKATGRSTDVNVTDRGPVRQDRKIDVSKKAAQDVGMTKSGTAPVAIKADPAKQTDPAVKRELEQRQK
jgi:peptidoglycan lytic transglycosylase